MKTKTGTQAAALAVKCDAAWQDLLRRRSQAVESLLHSLRHLPREMAFSVLTSHLTITQLEDLAKFQASKESL